jgi:enterochelin esterase-like enzyme
MFDKDTVQPFIAVGLHCNHDRIREYGTARQPDYKGRGDKAPQYRDFVLNEMLPYLRSEYHASSDPSEVFFAGFSLGGLSAIDIAWSAPNVFGGAGVFSGALWWRWSDVRPEDPDADRIMHDIIATDTEHYRPNGQFFWFQAGTQDEQDDRNHNGVIDAIDDTLSCMEAIMERGYPAEQLRYLEIENGTHAPATWGKAMPDFLDWMLGSINLER